MTIDNYIYLLLFLTYISLVILVFAFRLVLKEDKDSTVAYLVAVGAVLIGGIATKRIYSIRHIPAVLLGSYLIGTCLWGSVALIRRIILKISRKNLDSDRKI